MIRAAVPKGTKKITAKVLWALGLWFDGNDYIVEDIILFEQKVWLFLNDQQKFDLLLSQQVQHTSEISELKSGLERLEHRLNNLRVSFKSYDD